MRQRHWSLLVALTLAGCRDGEPRGEASASTASAPSAAAAAAAQGTCAEHGVLEAVCTKCNPSLVPVFQAKGDWCAEHGFAESVCPICHPERGGRPAVEIDPAETTSDAEAKDGTRIRFKSVRSAELAGIETAPVRVGSFDEGVSVFGTIVPDAARLAHANARVPGVMTRVIAETGTRVRRGDGLALITSSEAGAAAARVRAAEARVASSRQQHEREASLRAEGITSEQDLAVARTALEQASADLAAARSETSVLGRVGAGGEYRLTAPIDGIVIERHASVGQLVHPDDQLFTIVDATRAWVELDIPEQHLARAAAGTPVEIETPGGGVVPSRIDYVSPVLDPVTRTARARAAIDNASGALPIHGRVKARLLTSGPASGAAVPTGGVQRVGEGDVVFVWRAPDEFELVRVQVAERRGDAVVVRSRLVAGETVATTGSFLLKTEVLKARIGSGCCEIE